MGEAKAKIVLGQIMTNNNLLVSTNNKMTLNKLYRH